MANATGSAFPARRTGKLVPLAHRSLSTPRCRSEDVRSRRARAGAVAQVDFTYVSSLPDHAILRKCWLFLMTPLCSEALVRDGMV